MLHAHEPKVQEFSGHGIAGRPRVLKAIRGRFVHATGVETEAGAGGPDQVTDLF